MPAAATSKQASPPRAPAKRAHATETGTRKDGSNEDGKSKMMFFVLFFLVRKQREMRKNKNRKTSSKTKERARGLMKKKVHAHQHILWSVLSARFRETAQAIGGFSAGFASFFPPLPFLVRWV